LVLHNRKAYAKKKRMGMTAQVPRRSVSAQGGVKAPKKFLSTKAYSTQNMGKKNRPTLENEYRTATDTSL
jgi:hypothetical protein